MKTRENSVYYGQPVKNWNRNYNEGGRGKDRKQSERQWKKRKL